MERPVKKLAPSMTMTITPRTDHKVMCNRMPRMMAKRKTMSAWLRPRMPAAIILPHTKARRGVGVTSSFCNTPVSRSMMTYRP